jgi:hypothetical protein
MGYQLRMSAEIAEWLGDLRESDPVTAAEVGAALVAVMDAADVTALPFVTATEDPVTDDPRERLDIAYQRMLEVLQRLRRKSAEVATLRKQLESVLSEQQAAVEAGAERADLERQLAAARRREQVVSERLQGLQVVVDSFRSAKETAKAVVTAAEAQQRIKDAFLAAGIDDEEDPTEAIRDAHLKADEALATADRMLRGVAATTGLRVPGSEPATAGDGPLVLELHADPLGTDVRILFAIEPADTATLLAVLEGEAAISRHREQAIDLAGDLLTEIRDNGWPSGADDTPAGGPEFADPAAFLAEHFPAEAAAVERRSATIAGAVSLRDLRGERDLAEMSQLTGIPEERLHRIDRKGLHAASVREAAAYVRAVGGRLEITVTIDGESRVLSTTPDT